MFKTLSLTESKETLIGIGVGAGLFALVILNAILLVPAVVEVYAPAQSSKQTAPIDATTVNQAVEILDSLP